MDEMLQKLHDPDVEVRLKTVAELREQPLSVSCRLFLAALQDESWRVRKAATEALVELCHPEGTTVDLLRIISIEENASARNAAIESLMKFGKKVTLPLIAAFDAQDRDVKKFIIDILGEMKDRRSLPLLVKALKEEDENIRASAIEHLGGMGDSTNPSLIDRARTFDAPGAAVHGYRTMLDLMTDLNPLTGHLYVEALHMTRVARDALHMTRVAREGYVLLCGKYPHPQTMVPGGMSTTLTPTVMHEVFLRLSQFFDYSKKIAAIWDDITTFFYAANPEYRKVGARRAHLIDTGIFDDPTAYDATYGNASQWGNRRWATPGAIVDGKLVTTDLHLINIRDRQASTR